MTWKFNYFKITVYKSLEISFEMMEEFIIKRSVFYRELEEKYEKLKKELKKPFKKKIMLEKENLFMIHRVKIKPIFDIYIY